MTDRPARTGRSLHAGLLLIALAVACATAKHQATLPTRGKVETFTTGGGGQLGIYSASGGIDRENPFFKPLGPNGTSCDNCHFTEDAMGLSAVHARSLFDSSGGKHPLFRPEAANNPKVAATLGDDATIAQRRDAYGLLLNKGDVLVRIPLRTTADANGPTEFTLVGVRDQSIPGLKKVHVARVGDVQDPQEYLAYTGGELWVHRRPVPAVAASFITATPWDGWETPSPSPTSPRMRVALTRVNRNMLVRREAPPPAEFDTNRLDMIADELTAFQYDLFAAQAADPAAGALDEDGGRGGPSWLSVQEFYFGINDAFGDNPAHVAFTPEVFDTYERWAGSKTPARAAIARGETLFNSRRLTIGEVGGLNDANIAFSDGKTTWRGPSELTGTCGTCHDARNIGVHSTRLLMNIGVSDAEPAAFGTARVSDLPTFYLRQVETGETIATTDPGRALRTGKWSQIGQFKVPGLRGLAARAPYFHNGMASTLDDVVDYYDERFRAGFTPQEKADLVAFLRSL
jgi:hypothetical protein